MSLEPHSDFPEFCRSRRDSLATVQSYPGGHDTRCIRYVCPHHSERTTTRGPRCESFIWWVPWRVQSWCLLRCLVVLCQSTKHPSLRSSSRLVPVRTSASTRAPARASAVLRYLRDRYRLSWHVAVGRVAVGWSLDHVERLYIITVFFYAICRRGGMRTRAI